MHRLLLLLFSTVMLVGLGCGGKSPELAKASSAITDISEISAQLDSPNWRIRSMAAVRLGTMGAVAAEAVPRLEKTRDGDANDKVRDAAAQALEKIKQATKN